MRLRARLDHVASLSIPLDYTYAFKVKCTSCNEQHDKPVELTRTVRRGRRRDLSKWLVPELTRVEDGRIEQCHRSCRRSTRFRALAARLTW